MFIGALMGFVGVGLGAFGAHGLRGRLTPDMEPITHREGLNAGLERPRVNPEQSAGRP